MKQRGSAGLGSSFSLLLGASVVSNLGDGVRLAALPLLGATLTSSPLLIAGITAAQFLPWLTFAPFGGVIVDRSDRRRLIMVTQTWRALVMLALAIAVLADVVHIWQVFAVAFIITVGEILVDPSVVATVPTLVRMDDLDRANSRLSTVEIVSNDFVGSPIGAASFAVVPGLPFLLDALSYLASVVPFSRLPPTPKPTSPGRADPKPADSGPAPSVWTEMSQGLRWIGDHRFLRPLTQGVAIFNLGAAAGFSLLILLVTDVLGGAELAFTLVLVASAIGATSASLIAARLTDRFSRQTVITAAALLSSLSLLAAAATQAIWQLVAAWFVNGAAAGVLLSIGRGFVQRHTPNDRLGRTAIASRMITRTSFVVGALVAGSVATATSLRWSYTLAGLVQICGVLVLWRAFRFEPSEPEVDT